MISKVFFFFLLLILLFNKRALYIIYIAEHKQKAKHDDILRLPFHARTPEHGVKTKIILESNASY